MLAPFPVLLIMSWSYLSFTHELLFASTKSTSDRIEWQLTYMFTWPKLYSYFHCVYCHVEICKQLCQTNSYALLKSSYCWICCPYLTSLEQLASDGTRGSANVVDLWCTMHWVGNFMIVKGFACAIRSIYCPSPWQRKVLYQGRLESEIL